MAEIIVLSGETKKVASRFSSIIPEITRFDAEPLEPGEELKGAVEVRGSAWLFPKTPVRKPLEAQNAVNKGAWDTFFSVWVEAEGGGRIRVKGSQCTRSFRILIVLAILAGVLAAAIVVASLEG